MFSCLALTFQHKSNTPKNINGERGSENLNEHQRRGQRRKERIKIKNKYSILKIPVKEKKISGCRLGSV